MSIYTRISDIFPFINKQEKVPSLGEGQLPGLPSVFHCRLSSPHSGVGL